MASNCVLLKLILVNMGKVTIQTIMSDFQMNSCLVCGQIRSCVGDIITCGTGVSRVGYVSVLPIYMRLQVALRCAPVETIFALKPAGFVMDTLVCFYASRIRTFKITLIT